MFQQRNINIFGNNDILHIQMVLKKRRQLVDLQRRHSLSRKLQAADGKQPLNVQADSLRRNIGKAVFVVKVEVDVQNRKLRRIFFIVFPKFMISVKRQTEMIRRKNAGVKGQFRS